MILAGPEGFGLPLPPTFPTYQTRGPCQTLHSSLFYIPILPSIRPNKNSVSVCRERERERKKKRKKRKEEREGMTVNEGIKDRENIKGDGMVSFSGFLILALFPIFITC
jgi:hypothetical protein